MSNHGLKRNLDEKFYTKINIAKTCIAYFMEIIKPSKKSKIIEPSAGNGSFSNVLRKKFKNLTAIDIHKELDYVIQRDYLTYEPDRNNTIHDEKFKFSPPLAWHSTCIMHSAATTTNSALRKGL